MILIAVPFASILRLGAITPIPSTDCPVATFEKSAVTTVGWHTGVDVGLGVSVGVNVAVSVGVNVAVDVSVGVNVAVFVGVSVGVNVAESVGVNVAVDVNVGVSVTDGVVGIGSVGDGVGLSVGGREQEDTV